MNKTYITAALSWGATPTEVVDIRNTNGTRLATFPPDFLAESALNWQYILHVVRLLLEAIPTDIYFVDSDGLPVSLDSLPRAGAFTLKQQGMFLILVRNHDDLLTRKATYHLSLSWLEVQSIFAGTLPLPLTEARLGRTRSKRVHLAVK
jgi:hypothetical protein